MGLILGGTVNFMSAPPYNVITGLNPFETPTTGRPGSSATRSAARTSGPSTCAWPSRSRIGPTNLQLIVEAFNVFNHVNPTGYVGNLTSPNFGQPTRTAAGAFGPRQIQFGLRLDL